MLDAAVAAASVDGLDGLSLARLAAQLGVSKSALFAHWHDKQQLQLDIVAHARAQWGDQVVRPAATKPAGLPRLWALHQRRLRFYDDSVLPGLCFFHAAQAEFDDRPGPVRDAVGQSLADWLALLTGQARSAIAAGQLPESVDPAQLAFEIEALAEAVVVQAKLIDRRRAMRFSRRAVLDRLRSLATDPSLLPKESR